MPVFADDGITLTLSSGQTVTLIERAQSVVDRQMAQKRAMSITHDVTVKQKRVEAMQERLESLNDKTAEEIEKDPEAAAVFDAANEMAAEVFVRDLNAVYAEALARRFVSWDFYATKADFDAGKPVVLTKDAILEQFQYQSRASLLNEIVKLLGEYDKRNERKNVELPVNSGGQSRTEVPTIQ